MVRQAAVYLAAGETDDKLVPGGSTQHYMSRERKFGKAAAPLSQYFSGLVP